MPTEQLLMEDFLDLRGLLIQSRKAADSHLRAIREAPSLSYRLLERELTAYVLAKYLLKPEDLAEGISFNDLTDLSLSKSMQVSPELVKEFDTAQSCDGATSAMAKKVLLFRSIERGLELQLPAARSARLKSMQDFVDMVWDTLQENPAWAPQME